MKQGILVKLLNWFKTLKRGIYKLRKSNVRNSFLGERPDKESLFAVSPLHLSGESQIYGCIIRFAAVSVPEVCLSTLYFIYY